MMRKKKTNFQRLRYTRQIFFFVSRFREPVPYADFFSKVILVASCMRDNEMKIRRRNKIRGKGKKTKRSTKTCVECKGSMSRPESKFQSDSSNFFVITLILRPNEHNLILPWSFRHFVSEQCHHCIQSSMCCNGQQASVKTVIISIANQVSGVQYVLLFNTSRY